MGTVDGVTTVYIGGVYEWQAGASTAYYAGPDGPVAFRRSGYATDNGVFYLLRDHLGSSSVIVDGSGSAVKREFYYPFGGNRGDAFSDLTSKRFTGQYHEVGLPGGEGLSYYNARWYDAQLGRFVSADTIVPEPEQPQDWNRYAYVRNNPLGYTDPTGHYSVEELQTHFGVNTFEELGALFGEGGEYENLWGWYDVLRSAHDGDTVTVWNPHAMTPISGTFARDADGRISINMGGQAVDEAIFAHYGGLWEGANADGWGLEYGAYATDTLAMRPAMSGSRYRTDIGCNTWDCVAISHDLTGMGLALAKDSSLLSAPITGLAGVTGFTVGQIASWGNTASSFGWTIHQKGQGKASWIDVGINAITGSVGVIPIPGFGEAASATQLIYDVLDPFTPW